MSIDDVVKHARIATPCSANWEEMAGDDKMRFCGKCNLNVLNAAQMTDEEVLDAFTRISQGQRVCMRLYRRQDGTLLTKDCPVGIRKVQAQLRRAAAWLAGGLSLLLTLPAIAQAGGAKGAAGKPKPLWHSKIQATAPAETKQCAPSSAGSWQGASQPSVQPLLGDVAIPADLQPKINLHTEKLKLLETKHGKDALALASELEALYGLYMSQYDRATSESYFKRMVSILEKHKQYKKAYEVCIARANNKIWGNVDESQRLAWKQQASKFAALTNFQRSK